LSSTLFLALSAVFQVKSLNFTSIFSLCVLNSQNRYLLASGAYSKDTKITQDNLPDNPAAKNIAKGLAKAHEIYNSPPGTAIILFVVQDPERNIFDQKWIEYLLLEDYNIQSHRMTLEEISSQAKVENHRIYVPRMGATHEISVVYYRSGYGPEDYLSESQWKARYLLEISMAIKCPNILAQLTTCKKVQQALTMPNTLERYPFRISITLLK
jgi:glutathione synthase